MDPLTEKGSRWLLQRCCSPRSASILLFPRLLHYLLLLFRLLLLPLSLLLACSCWHASVISTTLPEEGGDWNEPRRLRPQHSRVEPSHLSFEIHSSAYRRRTLPLSHTKLNLTKRWNFSTTSTHHSLSSWLRPKAPDDGPPLRVCQGMPNSTSMPFHPKQRLLMLAMSKASSSCHHHSHDHIQHHHHHLLLPRR